MSRLPALAAALLLVPLALPLSAQPSSTATARPHADTNGDGMIDRAEAAKHPRLSQHFDRLDRNQDGRLSPEERKHHRGHGQRHRGGLERLDSDQDGRISRAEFDAAQSARATRHQGKPAHGKWQRQPLDFQAIDGNRDGYIVRAEMRAHQERMRPQREAQRKARFDAAFAKADINRDGQLSRLEVSEHMPRLTSRFAWMDDNRDGQLSRNELQPPRSHR